MTGQPHSPEAERSILSAVLLDNETIEIASDLSLSGSDFFVELHRRVWLSMCKIRRSGGVVDLVTVHSELVDNTLFNEQGGVLFLTGLLNSVPAASQSAIKSWVGVVKHRAARRRMIELSGRLTTEASKPAPNVGALFCEFTEIADRLVSNERIMPRHVSIVEVGETLIEKLRGSHKGEKAPPFVPTFSSGLNELVSGWREDHWSIVGGVEKAGKTSLACQDALFQARAGNGVVFSTIEMPEWQLLGRMALSDLASGMTEGELWNPEPPVNRIADIAATYEKIRELQKLPIQFVPSTKRRRVDKILSDIELAIDAANFETRIVMIDYWQKIKSVARYRDKHERLASVADTLVDWIVGTGIAGVCLVQLNAPEPSKGPRREPEVRDISYCKQFARDAAMSVMIHRPNQGRCRSTEPEPCSVVTRRVRFGRQGSVPLMFDGPNTRFLPSVPGTGFLPGQVF